MNQKWKHVEKGLVDYHTIIFLNKMIECNTVGCFIFPLFISDLLAAAAAAQTPERKVD